ncbi:MAG TPA: hypothetical protein VGJ15_07385, partial [Pirellulales bacterium]
FLSIVEHQPHGLFGGYLILNLVGRPLEFHCTTPVKPSRAQQILYGPTLAPFLYGEHIGLTLVKKSSLRPLAVLVDQSAALAVRQYINVPTALVDAQRASTGGSATDETASAGGMLSLAVALNRLSIPTRFAADREAISAALTSLDNSFDLAEPFERIREAIDEAQRAGSKAA